jgi:hypothetical protein
MIKASKRDNWKSLAYLDNGKDDSQRKHCLRRLRERIGVRLSESDYDHVISCIKNDKISEKFEYQYVGEQSNRVSIYEIKFQGKVPVNVLYDKDRKTIVTILFQTDDNVTEITSFYDVFNNKVNVKHTYGYNKGWRIEGDRLEIPAEVTKWENGYWEVISEGQLQGKRFKIDNEHLIEVM